MHTLTLATRCDRSESEAAAVVVEINGKPLALCAHHYRKHVHALSRVGAVLTDTADGFNASEGYREAIQPGASEPEPVPSGFTADV